MPGLSAGCCAQRDRLDRQVPHIALQGHGDTQAELVSLAFDLLRLDGQDLARLPPLERKASPSRKNFIHTQSFRVRVLD
jgi:hypothetical protein